MWKLKANVKIEQLKQYGYEYYIDYSNWAKLFYTKIGNWQVEHHIEFNNERVAIQQVWDDEDGCYYNEKLQEEYIQDLIKADLVEKVEDIV